MLSDIPNLEEACHSLVQLANENGGRDNVTVILARVSEDDELADLDLNDEISDEVEFEDLTDKASRELMSEDTPETEEP